MPIPLQAELLVQAMHAANDGILITDYRLKDNPIVFVNAAFEKLTGYSKDEILFKNCRFLQNGDRDQRGIEVVRRAIERGEACRVEVKNYKKNGTLFWNELSIAPLFDENGEVTHFVGVQKDITNQKRFEEVMFAKVKEDPLTQLSNRRAFFLEARRAYLLAKRSHLSLSLVLLDVDKLKEINDCYGHREGDAALVAVAHTLVRTQRESDLAARYGGDEFILLFIENENFSLASWKKRFFHFLSILNGSDRLPFELSVSMGASRIEASEHKSLFKAIDEADKALYVEKNSRGSSVETF